MHRTLVLVVLGVSPFLLGSNRQIFWSFNSFLTSLALFLLARSLRQNPPVSPEQTKVFLLFAGILVAVAGWMLFQAAPWTPVSWHHPVWLLVAPFGATGSLSINPSHTLASLAFLAPLSLMLVALREARDLSFFRQILVVTALTATAVAVFGAAVMALDTPTLGLIEKTRHFDRLTGTFASENSAATYFCFGMIAALVLVEMSSSPAGARDERRRSRDFPRHGWFAAAALLFGAVVLTGSRGGLIACAAGLTVFSLMRTAISRRRLLYGLLVALLCSAVVFLAAASGVGLLSRGDMAASTAVRVSLYQEAVAAIGERPIAGHGAGAYRDVEPLYHRKETPSDFVWTRAHSTYLESAAVLGLPIVVGVLVTIAWMLARLMAASRPPAPQVLAGVPIAAIAAIHSVVDYSLQIQAVAVACSVFLGAALSSLPSKARPATAEDSGSSVSVTGGWRSPIRPHRLGLTLVLILAIAAFTGAVRAALIELSLPSRVWLSEVRAYVPVTGSSVVPAAFRDTIVRLVDDPYLTYASAPECQTSPSDTPGSPAIDHERALECLSVIDAALRRAPAAAALWLRRAELLAEAGHADEAMLTAVRNSYASGGMEGHLGPVRLRFLLPLWRNLPDDIAADALHEFGRSEPDAIAAVATAAVERPSILGVVHEALAEIGSLDLEASFAEAVQEQSDRIRRRSDRTRSRPCAVELPKDDCQVRIEIVAVANALESAAVFKLWVNGQAQGTFAAQENAPQAGHGALQLPDNAPATVIQKVADVGEKLQSVEIEFLNDAWNPPTGEDRNLDVKVVLLDGVSIALTDFATPFGSEAAALISEDRILLYRNGTVRYEAGGF